LSGGECLNPGWQRGDGDRCEDDASAVDEGVFVVAGGEASPVLDVVEGAFDDVAVLVVGDVEGDGSPAA
jgi:hypothetical protein